MPRRSERNLWGRPRASNVPPGNEIDGDIDYGTTATEVSTVTMTPDIIVATR